jgi:RimJ/RimL family protein N-acetyltransferase
MAGMGEVQASEVLRSESGNERKDRVPERENAVIPDWPYQTDKVALIPYDKAWPVFPDGVLGHLYLRTKQDRLAETVFCGGETFSFDWFVSFFADTRKTVSQIYCLKNGAELIPIGYCWVSAASGRDGARRAPFGFLFFREYWGRPELRDLVMLCLAYWFEVLKIDVLHGFTLADNFLAQNFARRFHFTEVGTVPKLLHRQGDLTDARVVMLEKDTFEPRLKAWRERQRI